MENPKIDRLIIFDNLYELFENASAEDTNALMKAMCKHAQGKEIPEMTYTQKMLFSVIRGQIDAAQKNYDEKKKTGAKGGRPKKENTDNRTDEEPEETIVSNEKPMVSNEKPMVSDEKPWFSEKNHKINKNKINKNKINEIKKDTSPPMSPQGDCKGDEIEEFAGSNGDETAKKAGSNYKATANDADFDRFWKVYPCKKAKQGAQKAWRKLNPSPELVETILAAVEQQKRSPEWCKDGGKFVPHPATWLNGGRWEDEPTTACAPVPDSTGSTYDIDGWDDVTFLDEIAPDGRTWADYDPHEAGGGANAG